MRKDDMARYTLTDAIARHHEHPATFDRVPARVIARLQPGDFVKVCAEFPSQNDVNGERFWLLIREVSASALVGEIDNKLVHTRHHGLRCGDTLTVEPRHIMDTLDMLT